MSSHYSYVSCMETDRLFELMFPDSAIAKSFRCGEKKSAYIICHGLAPYFCQQLKDQVRLLNSFVILFDESFNRFTQNKQIHIRFFDEGRNAVHTRYFTSAFLGHATATNMVDVFVEKCGTMNLSNMIQLSMDGPNVNWSFYQKLMAEVYDDRSQKLIDIGQCIQNWFRSNWMGSEIISLGTAPDFPRNTRQARRLHRNYGAPVGRECASGIPCVVGTWSCTKVRRYHHQVPKEVQCP